jgi:hypothetical protein
MLLSHTSGLVYEFTSPAIRKYLEHKGEESGFRELYASHLKDPLASLCKVQRLAASSYFVVTIMVSRRKSDHYSLSQETDGRNSPGLDWTGFMVHRCLSTRIRFPKPKD